MTSTAPFVTAVAEAPVAEATASKRSARLGFGTLALYGAGSLVENATTPILALLLFYLNILCGLSGSAAGAITGLTLVADAFADPLVGSISDNSRSRHGRRHPFMLLALAPIAIGIGLLFSVPAGLTGAALFVYAAVALLAARIALSFFIVPYMALGAELSDDYRERSTIVSVRVLFQVVAAVVTTFLIYFVFLGGPLGQGDRAAYAPLGWICGAIAVAGGLIATLGTLAARSRLHAAPTDQRTSLANFPAELWEVFRNPSFRWLFITCFIFFVAIGAAAALALHANTFFWHLKGKQLFWVNLGTPPGLLIGVLIASVLSQFIEKRSMSMIGLACIGLAQFGPVALRLSGIIRLDQAVPTLFAALVLAGIGASIALIGFQSMMADAADEHEHLFMARREGLYFAGITTSAKASSGIGAAVAGLALTLIGFPAGPAATSAHIPADTIRNLGLVYGPGAALFTVVAIVVLFNYQLNRAGHAKIREELDERRAANAQG